MRRETLSSNAGRWDSSVPRFFRHRAAEFGAGCLASQRGDEISDTRITSPPVRVRQTPRRKSPSSAVLLGFRPHIAGCWVRLNTVAYRKSEAPSRPPRTVARVEATADECWRGLELRHLASDVARRGLLVRCVQVHATIVESMHSRAPSVRKLANSSSRSTSVALLFAAASILMFIASPRQKRTPGSAAIVPGASPPDSATGSRASRRRRRKDCANGLFRHSRLRDARLCRLSFRLSAPGYVRHDAE
jgi:hypothetical protein